MELKYSITGKETSVVNEVTSNLQLKLFCNFIERPKEKETTSLSMSLSSKPFSSQRCFWPLLSIVRRMTMKVMMEVRVMFMSNMK